MISTILGVLNLNQALDGAALQAAINDMIAQGSEDDALATLAVDVNDLGSYVDQLTSVGQTALAASGTALLNQMNDLGYNASDGDPTVAQSVANLDSQYQSWLNGGAYKALNAAMASGALTPPAGAPNAGTGATTPAGGQAALTSAMSPTDTVANVNNTVGIAAGSVVQIDSEQMLVGGVTATQLTGLQRGYNPASMYGPQGYGASMYGPQGYGAPMAAPAAAHAAGAVVNMAQQSQYGTGAFDPGSYGGGGGGGGDDGSSGGDPFADDGGDSGASMDEKRAALEDDGSGDGGGDFGPSQDAGAPDDGSGGGDMDSDAAAAASALLDDSDSGASDGTYSSDDFALLDQGSLDEMLGGDINWAQVLYNPAGILMDAMSSPNTTKFTPGGHVTPAAGTKQPSPAVSAKLAQAQQRLANAQAALARQHGVSPAAVQAAMSSKYGSSGAYASPYASAQSTPQTAALAPDAAAPQPDLSELNAPADGSDVVSGLTTDDLADIAIFGEDLGFPMEESQDIIVQAYNTQITDREPDPLRTHGSMHRGAAYLEQLTYPPHGSSHGQEGGLVDVNEHIHVFGSQRLKLKKRAR